MGDILVWVEADDSPTPKPRPEYMVSEVGAEQRILVIEAHNDITASCRYLPYMVSVPRIWYTLVRREVSDREVATKVSPPMIVQAFEGEKFDGWVKKGNVFG